MKFAFDNWDVEEILRIRGVEVDHSTIQRWIYKFMIEMETQMRERKIAVEKRWRMYEMHIKMKGVWRYLY